MRDDQDPDHSHPPDLLAGHPDLPETRRRALLLQILAFAAIYLIWGSTYLAIRVGVRSLPPFLMGGCRFLTAGAILYTILRARGVKPPGRAEWARGALAGLMMLTAGNGLVTWAETRIASNLAALLIATTPLYVALLDWFRPGGAAPQRRVWLGIALGGIGLALLVTRGASAGPAPSGAAVVALLLAAFCWAAGSLYSRYGSMHAHPLMAAAQQMIVGGVAMLLLGLALGESRRISLATVSAPGLIAFGYLTLVGSLVAFSAFGWLVKTSTPARLSTTAYVNPVVAVILGWALLGETLSPRALAGAALIVCAVIAMTLRLSFRPSPRPAANPRPVA